VIGRFLIFSIIKKRILPPSTAGIGNKLKIANPKDIKPKM